MQSNCIGFAGRLRLQNGMHVSRCSISFSVAMAMSTEMLARMQKSKKQRKSVRYAQTRRNLGMQMLMQMHPQKLSKCTHNHNHKHIDNCRNKGERLRRKSSPLKQFLRMFQVERRNE